MKIYLNITNPVYVSSSDMSDEVRVTVKNKYIFQSQQNNLTVRQNFTSILNVPPMIEKEDVQPMMKLGDFSKNSMVFTLVIPFAFMVFMSVSMDSVWSMYLMMQIVSNLMHIFI